MSDSVEKNNESLPLGDLERIDKVCSQFEESWKAGNPVRIEDLLEGFAGQVRAKLLLELFLLEFEYRSQSDTDVPIEEYRQRFPDDLDIVEQALEKSTHDQTILTPGHTVDSQLIPERIRYLGDYEILEEIARGGMGIVFKARQIPLGRIVAVKIMQSGLLSSDEQIARFEREAKLAGRLQHPNIVAVHEVGRHEGTPYFSMDFVDGYSLSELVRDNPLPQGIAAEYLQVAAETVHKAHEQGILHRDLKPSNILIDQEDRVRITDFGLAKVLEEGEGLTVTDSIIGTPSYMPPEQAVGNKALIGVQSDVYSLGAVLYELLTGRPPFAAATAIETMHQVKTKEPVSPRVLNPDLPKDLETICLKCLEKGPHKRYGTAQELANDLQRFAEGRPVLARPVGSTSKAWRWMKRNPIVTALSLLSVLLLVSGTGVSTYFAVTAFQALDELDDKNKELERMIAELKEKTTQLTEKTGQLTEKSHELEETNTTLSQTLVSEQEQRNRGDWEIYESNLFKAMHAWEYGDLQQASHFLGRCRWDFRGWEHDYLYTLFTNRQRTLQGHYDSVTHVLFNRDGSRVISASLDGFIRVWNTATGEVTRVLKMDVGWITSLDLSSDGRFLAGGNNLQVVVWDLKNGDIVQVVKLQGSKALHKVYFSTDDQQLIMSLGDPAGISVWDWGHDKKIWHRYPTHHIRDVSPDRAEFLTGGPEFELQIRDLASGELIRSFTGHQSGISHAKYSPDGRYIVSASYDRVIKVWEAATGEELHSIPAHSDRITSLAFSPDGSRFLSTSWDHLIHVWETKTGQLHCSLKGHNSIVYAATFSPDGRSIVSGAGDRTVKIWKIPARRESFKLIGSPFVSNFVADRNMAVSPDGSVIVSLTKNHTLTVWEAATHRVLKVLEGISDAATSVALSLDGRLIATGHGRAIMIWDLLTGERTIEAQKDAMERLTKRFVDKKRGLQEINHNVSTLDFSPDATRIVSGAFDGKITIWDVATGEELESWPSDSKSLTCIRFSADGKRVISGAKDGTLTCWNASDGNKIVTLSGHKKAVTALVNSQDGSYLLSGSQDATIRMWDTSTGEILRIIKGHVGNITSLTLSPDGERIVSSATDRTIKVWNVDNGHELLSLPSGEKAYHCLEFLPDSPQIAACDAEGIVELLDGSRTGNAAVIQFHDGMVYDVAFSPDGQRIASAGADGTIKIGDAVTGLEIKTLSAHQEPVTCVAYSPDGRWIISGSHDHTIKVWDALTFELNRTLTQHTKPVSSIDCSPDRSLIVSSSAEGEIKVWDTTTFELKLQWSSPDSWVSCVRFDSRGQRIVSGGVGKNNEPLATVKIWDAANGNELLSFRNGQPAVRSVCFGRNDSVIICSSLSESVEMWDAKTGDPLKKLQESFISTGSLGLVTVNAYENLIVGGFANGTIKVWDSTSGEEIKTLYGSGTCMAFSPEGDRLVCGSEFGKVIVWNLARELPGQQLASNDPIDEIPNLAEQIRRARPTILDNLKSKIEQAVSTLTLLPKRHNLRQIGLAFHKYHDMYHSLPSASSDHNGQHAGLSWRVHILPQLGQSELYKQFHLDEPWDSKHNKGLIPLMPDAFKTPEVTAAGKTVFQVVVGNDTAFNTEKGLGLRDFSDGVSNIALVIETGPEAADIWTRPGGIGLDDQEILKALGTPYQYGYLVLRGDGVTATLQGDQLKANYLKAIFTRNGGERAIISAERN